MTKINRTVVFIIVASVALVSFAAVPEKNERQPEQKSIDGYSNTPKQVGSEWHIHDPKRPQPKVVEPKYNGKPVPPPEGAKVLFDGDDLDQWTNKKWKLENGYMITCKGAQRTKEQFGNIHLHVEWFVPTGLKGFGQKQGNSGVFFIGEKYEIQVLNCWASRTYPDGMTGALYGQKPPLVNACRKPGEWQSYDIHFKAPVFKDNKLESAAYVTVYLNNVLVQDNSMFLGPTLWKRVTKYKPHGPKGPICLQYHGNPLRYRNIWAMPLKMKLGPDAKKK